VKQINRSVGSWKSDENINTPVVTTILTAINPMLVLTGEKRPETF
jgi:hypothetical protein